jgi:hypothetical protein
VHADAETGRVFPSHGQSHPECLRGGLSGLGADRHHLDWKQGLPADRRLDLPIAKKIVEDHGGRIYCDESCENGTQLHADALYV